MKKYKFIPLYYILSFLIPALGIGLSLAFLGIYPGGEYTPLILDLRSEHLPFFNYINNIPNGFNSLEYQSLGALGGGVINSIQMYCSPLFYVCSFFDFQNIPWVIWGIIIALIGLCGLSEFIYLKHGFPEIRSNYKALLLSACYALMSCMVIYTIVPVWIWGGVFLPFVVIGIDKVIDHKKTCCFIVSLTLSIIFNYYTSYILIIFSVLYFFYRIILLKYSLKRGVILTFKFVICGIESAMLSAFSWIPVLSDLMIGKGTEKRSISYGIIRNPLNVLRQLLPMSYDGLTKHSLPYIFCGSFITLLVILYFFDKKESVRNKLISLSVILIFLVCFCVGLFDILWMFFAEPNGYPSRYSFVFSFFTILIASKKLDNIELKFKLIKTTIYKVAILFIVLIELLFNTIYLLRSINENVGPYSEYAEYNRVYMTMQAIESEYLISDNGRSVKNWRYTNDDGLLYGYSDLDYFSSSYNSKLHLFFEQLGMNGQYHIVRSTGITPIVASVLNVEHFIQYGSSLEDYYSYNGTIDGLDIYTNDLSLPIAYSVNEINEEDSVSFGDNPFENINILLNELCGSKDVFQMIDAELAGNIVDAVPENDKHLWMYAKPSYKTSTDIQYESNDDLYGIYIGDALIGEYANEISPYCVDLGVGRGKEVTFRFNNDTEIENVYMASYDKNSAEDAINCLSEFAAYDVKYSSHGLSFSIDVDDESDILVTMPYIDGYSIYIDGEKILYRPYRNALILIDADAGHHNVIISYKDPGIMVGLVIGFAVLLVSVILLMYYKNLKNVFKKQL